MRAALAAVVVTAMVKAPARRAQLHAVQTEPAAGAGHQHALAEPDAADVAHRVELGPDRAGDDGGLFGGDAWPAP